jgi:phosphoglycerol transferase MdoB-like AlkP superfamily enzyme
VRPPGRPAPPLSHLPYLAGVYLAGLALFTLQRVALLFAVREQADGIPAGVLLRALGMGVRFDTVASCYLLFLPLALLTIPAVAGLRWRGWERLAGAFLALGYGMAFLAGAADIPYFAHFFSRLTSAVLAWTDTPMFMARTVLGEPSYYPYLGLFLASWGAFLWALGRLRRRWLEGPSREDRGFAWRRAASALALSLVAAVLLFAGARGRTTRRSPIRTGTAFFSTYALANQLGLNPAFTFWSSVLDAREQARNRLHLMDPGEAVERARSYLGLSGPPEFDSPVARRVAPEGEPRRLNVVIVIMESMAAERLARHGGEGLTPRLDELASRGWHFENAYTAGIHTSNGVYGTLFSLPSLLAEHPMKGAHCLKPFTGIGRVLREQGYETAFFCTHDEQFDNMGGFLANNGYGTIVGINDYPPDRVRRRMGVVEDSPSPRLRSTLRVPDHYMFEFAIPTLSRWASSGKPFLGVFLTASDHPPYVLPGDAPFRPKSADVRRAMLEYSDWAIGHLMDLASKEPWFENTVFAFVADHGAILAPKYDMPLSFHHTPMILFAPGILGAPRVFDAPAGQLDLGPTLLGLLNVAYVNNTMGVDLLRERRPAIYFTADDRIGCLDGEWFWVWRRNGRETLYRYRDGDTTDRLAEQPAAAGRLRDYAVSMLQATQWLVDEGKAGPIKNAAR